MSYTKQLQRIVREYRDAGQPWPASPDDIAGWAIERERWSPQRVDLIKQCARQISQAMGEEQIRDPQGRSVRAKHCRRFESGTLWDDYRTATREHMEISFSHRRQHVFGECRQLKTDVDSYNQNINPGEPIQMSLDFTADIAEYEAVEMGIAV